MKLIIMTKSTFFVEEDKILTTLFEEGLDCLHLYKPGASPMYSERLLSLLPEDYYSKIIVHDHFYLKSEYNLKGIHLDDLETPLPEGYKGYVGKTCNTISDIKNTKKNSNYVFLKNVFDCATDNSQESSFTLDELKFASKENIIEKKVYALGGINLENIRIAKDLGFGGIVVCDDLWNRFDIHNQQDYKDIISHFEKLRKAAD